MQLRIWIDLTNSPHVLVFRPMIANFVAQGHEVEVTARDFAQTLELCKRFGIEHTAVGRHRGGSMYAKAAGLASRSAQLRRWARGKQFDLALGHGSNDITVAAGLLRIDCVTMFDYEFAWVQHSINCRLADAVVVPDRIPPSALYRYGARKKTVQYPGLKEEYYLFDHEIDRAVVDQLGLDLDRVIVVLRTPPDVALYHRFSNELHAPLAHWLAAQSEAQVVVLPRTDSQRVELESDLPNNFVVPTQAVDAQSLIALSDLVVGAGGTMNREAVALATPAYTTFQGRLGAVDASLIDEGRMKRVSHPTDIKLEKKSPQKPDKKSRDPREMSALLLNCA